MGKPQDKQADAREVAALERAQLPPPPGLERHRFRDSLTTVYYKAAAVFLERIGPTPTPGSLREGMRQLHRYTESLLESLPRALQFEGQGRLKVACVSGCHWCCRFRVTCTAPTVLYLAEWLKSELDARELTDLLGRLRQYEAAGEGLNPETLLMTRRLCPLNLGGLCRAYAARPAPCRHYHSFDAKACETEATVEGAGPQSPMDPLRLDVKRAMALSLDACLESLGLDHRELEFVPALELALTVPDAAERYLRGEDVFGPAHRPEILGAAQERGL